jgi:hypothetical protein
VPHEPVAEAVVVGDFGRSLSRELLQVAALAPAGADGCELLAPLLLGRRPRVVVGAGSLHLRVEDDEPGAPFGIGGREQRADPRAGRSHPEHGSLGVGCIHHRADVVHRRLDRLHLPHAVREPGSALVEHQHASRLGEVLDVAYEQRLLPGGEQVAGRAADEHEVGRPRADDLVGDRDVAAPRVADFRRAHQASLSKMVSRPHRASRAAPRRCSPSTAVERSRARWTIW